MEKNRLKIYQLQTKLFLFEKSNSPPKMTKMCEPATLSPMGEGKLKKKNVADRQTFLGGE